MTSPAALDVKRLLAHGFLPRELPPPFTTEPFAEWFAADRSTVSGRDEKTECCRHNLARVGGFRRPLKLPNPHSYAQLALVLERHWTLISEHFKGKTFAISRPVLTRTAERAIRPRFRLGEAAKLRAKEWRGQRWILRADVSQFYPSLYTHSIPWALHTKPVAKANINKTDADQIDRGFRNCAGGQTVGVPIGPDASFLVAEVVLTAVDHALLSQLKSARGFRYLDDYELAFQTRSEADDALVKLEGALGDYELVINPFKTRILELPYPVSAPWTHTISQFPIRSETSQQALTDLIGLFSHAAEAASRHPGALKYALLRSRSVRMDGKLWKTFQGLVWSAVSSEPTTLPTALDLLKEKAAEGGAPIDVEGASQVLETMITLHAPLRNGSEVAWALWAAVELGARLSEAAAKLVVTMEDDFVALTALHASAEGLFPEDALDRSEWESLIDYDEVLKGPHWLLAYEAAGQGWLESARSRVEANPFFSGLSAADIRFYDRSARRPPFSGPAGPLPGANLPDEYL